MESSELEFQTGGRLVTDATDEVRAFARETGGEGLLHLFLPHSTAGLALMEIGSGSESDLEDAVGRLLPRDDRYDHAHGPTGHGADHLLPTFVSPTLTLVVDGGSVVLGTWQSIVIVDPNRDNNRRRLRLTLLRSA